MDAPTPGKRWHTREDSGIRLDRQGRWFHDDELVEHPKIIEAFNVGLAPSDDGRFILRFGADWCFVAVEDAAFRVNTVDEQSGQFLLRLTDRTTEPLVPETLCVDDEGVLMCQVKSGKAWARFSRDAQFELGGFMTEANGELFLGALPVKPRG